MVGIGASAGGLEAFTQVLAEIPPDSGMAFVLIQHLDPHHDSRLAEILSALSKVPVVTVRDGMHIEPNRVFVIPPNTGMVLDGSRLKLVQREPGLHLPIDIFFCSLARVQGSRAIGVVLSGNAADGSLGLRAIKAECGLTFAQEESTARFGGMPHNAIATGAVDYVLPPAEIGRQLAELGGHPYLIPARSGAAESETLPEGDGDLKRMFALLKTATKVDFSHYKTTTVRRRIGRRMMVLRVSTLREYLEYAQQDPNELRELYRDLLINVSSFFRNREAFEALRPLVSDMLSEQVEGRDEIRVWVPGCATGEEPYSLAICLTELLQQMQLNLPIQLFATDISDLALERARQGIYPEIITETVSAQRLKRFFTKVDSGYQIAKLIRENCIFARHDVTRDPPFSRIDLLSCRNVLIYLATTAQRHVLPLFHYALKPSGLLFLGSAETPGAAGDLFVAADKEHNIYRRKESSIPVAFDFAPRIQAVDSPAVRQPHAGGAAMDLHKRLDQVIQSKYSPDAVLVDADLQILQFRGHTSDYLDPAPEGASLNLLRVAREGLVMPLRHILKAAAEAGHSVKERGVILERDDGREEISLEVTPVPGATPNEKYWLIAFLRAEQFRPEVRADSVPEEPASEESRLAQVERQLANTREYLRNMTVEYQAHAEELEAANEEVRSANEELQSTNEELGTTKEELQSANEELITINDELQKRNLDLSSINSDLRNLFAAVSVAILMVDSDLRVRRFNSVAEKLLDLSPIDIGRPVGHFRGRIKADELENQIQKVIETLHTMKEEVQDNEGHWYLVTTRPYRTVDDHIAGAVITVQDIDPLKRGLEAAEEARDCAEAMLETVREPLVVLDADLRIERATRAFYETFLVSREETLGRFLYDLGNGQWNRPDLRERIGKALFRNEAFQDYEVHHNFPHIGYRTMRLNGRRISRRDAKSRTLLLAIEDVTERREVAEIRFQRLFETAKDGIMVVEAESDVILDVNPYLVEATGFAREDIMGKKISEVELFFELPAAASLISLLVESESIRFDDVPIRKRGGGTISMELVANLYKVGSQPVAQLNLRDITVRKEQEESLRRSIEEKAVLVREIHHRVKNNLQVIVSLLSLQASYTKDAQAHSAFRETEERIRAIAQIHETLHASPDLAQIEFASYLTGLVRDLVAFHSPKAHEIALDLQVEEMVLDMEQAIPLGLMANELVVNALKHGLSDGQGRLAVGLKYKRDPEQLEKGEALDYGWAELRVSDDGPGLPSDVDFAQARSMGFKLLNLLKKQLRGKVEFLAGPGATALVEFPLSPEVR